MRDYSETVLTPGVRNMRHEAAQEIKRFLCETAKRFFGCGFPLLTFVMDSGGVPSHAGLTIEAPGILLGYRDFPLRHLRGYATVEADERTRRKAEEYAKDRDIEKIVADSVILVFLPEGLFFFKAQRGKSTGGQMIFGSGTEVDPDAYLMYCEEVFCCFKQALECERKKHEELKLHPHHIVWREIVLLKKRHLRAGSDELNIGGMKGYPGHSGYLDHLRIFKSMLTDISMIYQVDNEIERCEARLAVLEKSPEAIREHLAELTKAIFALRMGIHIDPESDEIESMRKYHREWNEKICSTIRDIEAEIEKYSALLATLTPPTIFDFLKPYEYV